MIAITFALPAESSGLARSIRERKFGNRDVVIWHTGVGREIAARKIDNFLHAAQPRFLISAGFAGAVRDDLNVGDLILAENFSDSDLLVSAQKTLGNRACLAKLFTAATVVDSIAERKAIAPMADAVDMETEVIARAFAARGIPMLSLRAISDSPREPFPAPPHVLFDIGRQRTNPSTLSLYLLRHPAAVGRLIRFAKRIERVRNALTEALIAVGQSLL